MIELVTTSRYIYIYNVSKANAIHHLGMIFTISGHAETLGMVDYLAIPHYINLHNGKMYWPNRYVCIANQTWWSFGVCNLQEPARIKSQHEESKLLTEIERFLGRDLSSWAGNGRNTSSSALVYLDLLRLPVVLLQRVGIAVNPNMKTMYML